MVEMTAVVVGTSVLKEKGTVIMIAIVLQALFVVRTTVKGLTLTLQMTVAMLAAHILLSTDTLLDTVMSYSNERFSLK